MTLQQAAGTLPYACFYSMELRIEISNGTDLRDADAQNNILSLFGAKELTPYARVTFQEKSCQSTPGQKIKDGGSMNFGLKTLFDLEDGDQCPQCQVLQR